MKPPTARRFWNASSHPPCFPCPLLPWGGEAVAGRAAFEFSFWDVQAQSEFNNLEEQDAIMMVSWNSNVRIASHKIEIVHATFHDE